MSRDDMESLLNSVLLACQLCLGLWQFCKLTPVGALIQGTFGWLLRPLGLSPTYSRLQPCEGRVFKRANCFVLQADIPADRSGIGRPGVNTMNLQYLGTDFLLEREGENNNMLFIDHKMCYYITDTIWEELQNLEKILQYAVEGPPLARDVVTRAAADAANAAADAAAADAAIATEQAIAADPAAAAAVAAVPLADAAAAAAGMTIHRNADPTAVAVAFVAADAADAANAGARRTAAVRAASCSYCSSAYDNSGAAARAAGDAGDAANAAQHAAYTAISADPVAAAAVATAARARDAANRARDAADRARAEVDTARTTLFVKGKREFWKEVITGGVMTREELLEGIILDNQHVSARLNNNWLLPVNLSVSEEKLLKILNLVALFLQTKKVKVHWLIPISLSFISALLEFNTSIRVWIYNKINVLFCSILHLLCDPLPRSWRRQLYSLGKWVEDLTPSNDIELKVVRGNMCAIITEGAKIDKEDAISVPLLEMDLTLAYRVIDQRFPCKPIEDEIRCIYVSEHNLCEISAPLISTFYVKCENENTFRSIITLVSCIAENCCGSLISYGPNNQVRVRGFEDSVISYLNHGLPPVYKLKLANVVVR